MLRELEHVRQHPGEGRRRWFADGDMDLVLWHDPEDDQRVVGFQLCYDKGENEHALTWREPGSVTHHRVDDGQPDPVTRMTPILVQDGAVPLDRIRQQFADASAELDPRVREYVSERLQRLDERLEP
jgi:hypothetical protein